jgi:hypothetical protein
VTLRGILVATLTAWVAASATASAGTTNGARHPRRVSAITVAPHGHGSVIRIVYAGGVRPMVRIIESRDPIEALAVADVDNDGDLDILASAHDGALVMWRNAGHGRFRLATAPERRIVKTADAVIGRCHHVDAPIQAGDDRYDAALPRAPAVAADAPVLAHFLARFISVVVPIHQRPSGRAPPTHT